jgi:hypothetical protein
LELNLANVVFMQGYRILALIDTFQHRKLVELLLDIQKTKDAVPEINRFHHVSSVFSDELDHFFAQYSIGPDADLQQRITIHSHSPMQQHVKILHLNFTIPQSKSNHNLGRLNLNLVIMVVYDIYVLHMTFLGLVTNQFPQRNSINENI